MSTATGTVFLMTDKKLTKDCPCTYPGCNNICRVNTFYAPAKAKCPPHGGKGMVRRSTEGDEEFKFDEFVPQEVETIEVELPDNRKLGQLYCPVCPDEPLEILAVDEHSHMDFGCQNCQIIVGITFNFRSAQLRSVPDRLKPLVKEFNYRQVGTMDAALALQLGKFAS